MSVLLVFSVSDRPEKLVRCIESICGDLLADDQIMLVVNGGAQKIVLALPEFSRWSSESNFNTVYLNERLAFGDALNIGLERCLHEYILRIDPDDISLPGRIEKQVRSLEKQPNLAVCGGWAGEMYDDSGLISAVRETPLDHDSIVKEARFKNPMLHVSVIMRKSCLEAVG